MDVALVHPQIPQNTGSIARTCAATGTPLHLIEPLGFSIDEKKVRRAGLDYWPEVDLTHHSNWESYLNSQHPPKVWALSKFGTVPYFEAPFGPEDTLVFGSETKGLGEAFLSKLPASSILKIPMKNTNVRSLNLSNAVSIVLYHALWKTQSLQEESSRG